jgi:DNA repair exonuclease SbcCD nuclease subunit
MDSTLILGDPHLGRSLSLGRMGLGSALNSRIVDQLNLLDWTLEQAIENGIQHLIITGDVFEDPKPFPFLITLFISWLQKCHAHGIQVHIIAGNHDILRTGNFYTSPLDILSESDLPNVFVYKEMETVFIDQAAFTFIPFRDRKSFNVSSNAEALAILQDSLVYELATIPPSYRKILIGHLALEGAIPVGDEIDDLTNELHCPLQMFKGYDYVWMGHIHMPQVLQKSPLIAHIGSMDTSNFGETTHKKHLVLLDLETGQFQHLNLPTRPLKKMIVSVPKDTKDTTTFVINEIEQVKEELLQAIVRLEIHLTSPELLPTNRSELEKHLYTLGVSNVSAITESKKLSPIKKDGTTSIDTTMDVMAAVKMWATSQIDTEKQSLFIETAADVYSEFQLQGT